MKACIQRVAWAQVSVGEQLVGRIGRGMLVLLGVAAEDEPQDARLLAAKTVGLRIFEDEVGKMNRSLIESGGAMLVVSQFTLLADCRKGRRPSFTRAAPPEKAQALYQVFVQAAAEQKIEVATGRFREEMAVELVNDGPVTILLDTTELRSPRAGH